jgi:hypothetical protein
LIGQVWAKLKFEFRQKFFLFCPVFFFFFFFFSLLSFSTSMTSKEPGVEHRDPQYFGYYAMLQHQVTNNPFSHDPPA